MPVLTRENEKRGGQGKKGFLCRENSAGVQQVGWQSHFRREAHGQEQVLKV